ncbi:MAG: HU family DNA-binding protein [Betaproteobacteria bacterium]|nr:HU family DNA-binding protein [Betaproteobacteria bacterium]
MKKADLIEAVSKESDLSKASATRAVDAILRTIIKTVSKKQAVQLIGFGSFRAVKRNARAGRNPATGEVPPVSLHPIAACWPPLQRPPYGCLRGPFPGCALARRAKEILRKDQPARCPRKTM